MSQESSAPDAAKSVEPSQTSTQSSSCGATSSVKQPRVCMKIVPVKVSGIDGGTEVETYAFLDGGSDTTLCLNELVDQLSLNGASTNFTLSTVSGSYKRQGKEVQLQVKSLDNEECIVLDRVLSVSRIPVAEQSIADSG